MQNLQTKKKHFGNILTKSEIAEQCKGVHADAEQNGVDENLSEFHVPDPQTKFREISYQSVILYSSLLYIVKIRFFGSILYFENNSYFGITSYFYSL